MHDLHLIWFQAQTLAKTHAPQWPMYCVDRCKLLIGHWNCSCKDFISKTNTQCRSIFFSGRLMSIFLFITFLRYKQKNRGLGIFKFITQCSRKKLTTIFLFPYFIATAKQLQTRKSSEQQKHFCFEKRKTKKKNYLKFLL